MWAWLWLACGGAREVDVWEGTWDERVWSVAPPCDWLPPTRVGVGDFDGDGADDLAVNWSPCSYVDRGSIVVYRGGAVAPPAPDRLLLAHEADDFPLGAAAGDLDGDGFDDLVHAQRGWLSWHRGGPRGLGDPELLPFDGFRAGVVPDLDGDGRDDLLLQDVGWEVLLGPEGSLAEAERRPVQGAPDDLVGVGDVNGDGTPDLLGSTGELFLLGPGGVPGPPSPSEADFVPSGRNWWEWSRPPEAGDVNGDGFSDVLTSWFSQVELRAGGPDGLRGPPLEALSDRTATLVDLDRDGYADLVTRANHETIEVLLGGPEGFEPRPRALATTRSPDSAEIAVAADFNGDGVLDLVLVDARGVRVFLWSPGGG